MAKYLIEESALLDLSVKFEHARALFDVLAQIGMHLAFDAAREVEKLIADGEVRHA